MKRVDLLNDSEVDKAVEEMPLRTNRNHPECIFCGKKVSNRNRSVNDERFNIKDGLVCSPCFSLWASNNVEELMDLRRKRLLK